MKTVSENTSCVLALTFLDQNGAPLTPNSGSFAIFDQESREIITPWTPFNPIGSVYNLLIPATVNQILKRDHESEVRVVSIIAVYDGGSAQATGEFSYEVDKLEITGVLMRVEITGRGGAIGGGSAPEGA